MIDVTTDTTVIVKGLIPPRRKKSDTIYEEYLNLHRKAKNILLKIESGIYKNHIPLVALIETVCVVARLTNDYESVKLALSFVSQNSELYSDAYLLEKAMEIGMRTKASGFDVVFMSCAEVTGSILITDDKRMYEKAWDYGLDAEFLRELNEEL
jgi:predicted nucleic acid-binding protein